MRMRAAIAAAGVLLIVAACDALFEPGGSGQLEIVSPTDGEVISADSLRVYVAIDDDSISQVHLAVDGFIVRSEFLGYGGYVDTARLWWGVDCFCADGQQHELVATGEDRDGNPRGQSEPMTVTVHESIQPRLPSLDIPIDGMVIARSAAVRLIWDSFCWVALHPLHEGILFTGQVATDAQFTSVRDEFHTDHRGYHDLGLLPPGEYYWRVRAETEVGAHSAWSQPYRLSVLDVDLDTFAESQGIPEAAEYVAGPGLHPLLGNPHWRTMPPEWFAQSVSELELVAVTDYRGVELLEECSYTGPGCPTSGCTIRRWSGALEAWLYTARDAAPLDSTVIWGSAPEACPSTYSFGVDKHLDWIGDPPKEDYLKIFLWPYVEQ